jgi:four helix bundle protein
MVKKSEDLQVFQKAVAAADAVFAAIQTGRFGDDPDLQRQLNKGSRRVPSDIAEGFEQRTNRHFAHFLYITRGASRELCTQINLAARRHLITEAERADLCSRYDEIAKMLTGLIRYLEEGVRE